jgi:hypothetical protein
MPVILTLIVAIPLIAIIYEVIGLFLIALLGEIGVEIDTPDTSLFILFYPLVLSVWAARWVYKQYCKLIRGH